MRLSKRRRTSGLGFDMTPMVDVVFQLIIFFMTVSQQSELEATPLELPKLRGALDQAPKNLTVNLTVDDRILVAGEPIDPGRFDALIGREVAAVGGQPVMIQVLFRVDRRSDCGLLNRLLGRLKAAGVTHARMAVEAPGGG